MKTPLRIALVGYGKMGKEIEKLALEAGHSITLKVDSSLSSTFAPEMLKNCDVAIEFSVPDAAVKNIEICLKANVPVVVGTTGWLQHLDEVKKMLEKNNGAVFYASNYSIGVNLFFRLNRYLSRIMRDYPQYKVEMEEIHHTQKLDAPSGTGISLANDILSEIPQLKNWKGFMDKPGQVTEAEFPLVSKRIENVPGTHTVTFKSSLDEIRMTHTAFSRTGFASGALAAAEWLEGKKGFFGMDDMLGTEKL